MFGQADPLEGIRTKPYVGRQRELQDMEQEKEELATRQARTAQINGGLVTAVTVLSVVIGLSVLCNAFQWRNRSRVDVKVLPFDQNWQQLPMLDLRDLPVTPTQVAIINTLTLWIEWIRTITPDGGIMNRYWDHAKAFTTEAVTQQLQPFRDEQRLRQAQGIRVIISPPKIAPISESRSYTVVWDETTISPSGQPIPDQSGRWEATLTLVDFQEKAIMRWRDLRVQKSDYRNLQGIVVEDIRWKRVGGLTLVPPTPGRTP